MSKVDRSEQSGAEVLRAIIETLETLDLVTRERILRSLNAYYDIDD